MRRIIGFALAGLLLGGCAVYADPYPYAGPPAYGAYVAPPPVVVAPYPYYWGWHHGWHEHEGWRVRKDGTTVEVSVSISPIKDTSGRVIGASVVSRDITRHKQEENERLALIQDLTAALTHVGGARLPTVVPS